MEFDIYFCNDGILRAKYKEDSPLIPMTLIQKELNQKDLSFWVRCWENNVYFEEGLTLAKFLICLEPWASFWSEITLKNIKAYIEEVRKPYNISTNKEKPLSWIGISYYTEMEPSSEYKDDDFLEEDINVWLNSPKESRLTGEWEIHSSYKINGYIKGEEEQYSIEFTPLNELANVPIVLDEEQFVFINEWGLRKHFGNNHNKLFVENPFGIINIQREKNNLKFFSGKKHHKMRAVIEGFFWWMYSEPSRRDDFSENLKIAVEEVKLNKEESTNTENNIETKEEKPLKVEVLPGAFDSMIESYEQDSLFWKNMLNASYKDNSTILKIGIIKKAEKPENRYLSYIEKEKKNLSSEFKIF